MMDAMACMFADLRPLEVHLWHGRLDLPDAAIDTLRESLSAEESERISRCIPADVRRRAIAARGQLRLVLGYYLGRRPEDIVFRYGRQGKPKLAGEMYPDGLEFNLSHSGEVVVYAVCRGADIGVDIERIRPQGLSHQVFERCFTEVEAARMQHLPAERRTEERFRFWTQREACAKAFGGRLADFFGQRSDQNSELTTCGGLFIQDHKPATQWSSQALDQPRGLRHAWAIAVRGRPRRIVLSLLSALPGTAECPGRAELMVCQPH